MVKRSKEDAEKTRESLLDAAETVFFAKGIAAASLEEIAKKAGMTRGAVYWHFDDKYALVEALRQRIKQPVDEMLERAVQDADPLKALHELCLHILCNLARDAQVQRIMTIMLFRCEQADAKACAANNAGKRAELHEKFEHIFRQAARRRQLAPGVKPQIAARALFAYIHGFVSDYLRHGKPYDLAAAAPTAIDIFFRGISRINKSAPARRARA